jgi:5'/3'-nucleotidase SurE
MSGWSRRPRSNQARPFLTLSQPIRLRKHGERKYSVSGTPTDAVMMALAHVMKDSPPDLILSGVNRGANLAEDVTYSGTVSAADGGRAGRRSLDRAQPGLLARRPWRPGTLCRSRSVG